MVATKTRRTAKPKRQGDVPSLLSSLYFLGGGISILAVLAVLVAVRWDPGLADFLFWLAAIWIALVRYMISSSSEGQFQQPSRPALRKWLLFSAIILMAAASLYALARMAASLRRS